jgi:cytochrome c553
MTVSAHLAAMISLFASAATREQRGTFDVAQAVSLRRRLTVCVTKTSALQKDLSMKVLTTLAAFIFAVLLVSSAPKMTANVSPEDGKKPPDIIVLGKDAKLGQVTFNHLDHITKNRSPDGTSQIACVECHHTAQPAAEALKHPPHKTVWPADRTTILTLELLETDPNAVGAVCRDCHARADTKPKLMPEIPQLKFQGSDEPTVLTNQQAFHRRCGSCHDAVVKARPDLTPAPPTSKKCVACHKKTAPAA